MKRGHAKGRALTGGSKIGNEGEYGLCTSIQE
jgi:hypothetical protein